VGGECVGRRGSVVTGWGSIEGWVNMVERVDEDGQKE
jgi:hypothetical protein